MHSNNRIEKDIKQALKEAEKFMNRCDLRVLNILPELKLKIESIEGNKNYTEYINKFYEIRDGFKSECMCGKKLRMESNQDKETEFRSSEGEIGIPGLGEDMKQRLADVMEYHRKGGK